MNAPCQAVSETAVRVILLDDHAVVREGIRALLEETPGFEVIGEFANGESALTEVKTLAPDVAVVDLRMPGLSGADTITGLLKAAPELNVLVFTSFGEDPQIRAALDAGAIGFLLKDAAGEDLVRALRFVARGEPWLHPSAQRQLMSMIQREPNPLEQLTERERSVLTCLAQGMSNKAVGAHLHLTEGTVKGYVSQILDKLGVRDRTQAALTAVKLGLLDNT